MERLSDNKRIAKNTLMLYFRVLLTLAVGLYASRVVLQTLGVTDYGLYNVVGGSVTLFTFLNGTLASGTQRFLSFALGKSDMEKMSDVFSTAFRLHLLFSICFLVVSEIGGLLLLKYMLNLPGDRYEAAFWVYQFSIIATMVSVIQVPFQSAIISHEKMSVYAYVSIFDAIAKLLIVYLIQVMYQDKLILYAFFILLVQLSTMLMYIIYCFHNYEESRSLRGFNKSIFKEIASFSGWNIFGCAAVAFQGQGVNILLNMFFGTVINAARGIAFQVNSVIFQFVNNFQTAVNPQIVKLYASGNKEKMISLVVNNSKIAAFFLLFIAIPVFIETNFLLTIWLGEYPEYTLAFVRIVIIQSLVQTINRPVVAAIHAVGKMKAVNLTAGFALLLILPVSYLLLRLGCSPIMVFWINIIPWFVELFFELYWLNKYIDFPLLGFYKRVYAVVFPLALLMLIAPGLVHFLILHEGWLRFIAVCIVSILSSILIIGYLGIPKSLRVKVISSANQRINHYLMR